MQTPSEVPVRAAKLSERPSPWSYWGSRINKPLSAFSHSGIHVFRSFLRFRWVFIATIGLLTLLIETVEYLDASAAHPNWVYERKELLLSLLMTALLAGLLEAMVQIDRKASKMTEILNQKHRLSLLLAQNLDYDQLASYIVNFPGTLMNIAAASLWIYNSLDDCFTRIATTPVEESSPNHPVFTLGENFRIASIGDMKGLNHFTQGKFPKSTPIPESLNIYCLPFYLGNALIGMMLFATPPGKRVPRKQITILNRVDFEIAIALKTAQQRKLLVETRIKEAVLFERKNVSRDLHDKLGQNLNFLRLKLDLMSSGAETLNGNEIQRTLVQMRDVADEACDQIHLILTDLYHNTQVGLEEAIQQYAQRVGDRSNLKIQLEKQGKPIPLLPEVSQHILYITREAINNIEKHAHAKCVCVGIHWGEDELTLAIVDDGKGIDYRKRIQATGLGMRFMSDCANKVNGLLELNSTPSRGTSVSLWVPLPRVG